MEQLVLQNYILFIFYWPRSVPESIDNREVQLERSSAANWISLSVFCYINRFAALIGDLAKIASWISLVHLYDHRQACQGWHQIWLDWPQMGHIMMTFFNLVFRTSWLTEPKWTENWYWKVPYLSHLEQIWQSRLSNLTSMH